MKWTLRPHPEIPDGLKSISLNPTTLRLLLQRGFFSKEEIERFLNTKYEDLHSPDHITGISEAVERIGKARKKEEKVTIFGDYDADGITSTVLLKETLEKIGILASTYIPDRNKEGYGLNKDAIDFVKKKYQTNLLITVDCGISNREEIEYARRKKIDVIVVDHHSVPKSLPEKCILINPKLPGQKKSFMELAGVGVTFKVCLALWEKFMPQKTGHLKWFLDLVAIGTIADCVPLTGENRIFAKFGLIVLQKTKRIGIQEIIKTARLNISEENPPSAENIAYQIGPRLNAAGRMDHADLTLNLLLEKDVAKARLAALELEAKNSERQKITQEVYGEVKKTLGENANYKLIIRQGKNWPLGVLGIVAGKIAEEYHCPTFIFRENGNIFEGSGRSINVFNLIEAVSQLDGLLEKYGGHSQAMGMRIKKNNLVKFEKKLQKIVERVYDKNSWGRSIYIDVQIPAKEIDWDIVSEIRKFEPFGEGNWEPVISTKDFVVKEVTLVGNDQKHLKLFLSPESGAKAFEGIFFQAGERHSEFKIGDNISVVYNLRSNEWNGNHKIELHIIDIRKNI
jgi:single-stranded-DNA-specific exonuclease